MKYSEGLEFQSNGNGTCYVRSIGDCIDPDIIIPSTSPQGDSVVEIGGSAFINSTNLLSVVVPGSVRTIGSCAFWGCGSLTKVVIEKGTKIIENYAFEKCNSLWSVDIPCSVVAIGMYAFRYCNKLSDIEIPSSVKLLGRGAFVSCYHLKNITLPNGIDSISSNLFTSCCNLKSINIGSNITHFDRGAFYDCPDLIGVKNNYKAFAVKNGKLKCRGKEYTIGKKSICRGDLIPCNNGIHYCTNIFDIFNYYYGEYGEDFVIGICEVSGKNIGHDSDSKRCTRWVIPKKILTREEVINIMNGGNV